MKRRRKMLLCVTATSMAAAVACTPAGQPVGKVGRPDYEPDPQIEAGVDHASDAGDAGALLAAPVTTDPVKVGKVAVVRDAAASPPDLHPDRVGTTAVVDDSPTVGTTAHVPDKKR